MEFLIYPDCGLQCNTGVRSIARADVRVGIFPVAMCDHTFPFLHYFRSLIIEKNPKTFGAHLHKLYNLTDTNK